MAETQFNELALDVFTFQYTKNQPYRRYCDLRGKTPENVSDWTEVPAVGGGCL